MARITNYVVEVRDQVLCPHIDDDVNAFLHHLGRAAVLSGDVVPHFDCLFSRGYERFSEESVSFVANFIHGNCELKFGLIRTGVRTGFIEQVQKKREGKTTLVEKLVVLK
eukprot:TRINITY_DN14670_c0_g1_i1.p1 TRINITY_DN14670_c0_g1~~TRINITY_DN14670_c0_g1_i1.p1  ORF type:complete len:110 (-),score=10.75 TRINITY_DN14670_c0_g1_i1:70-399(-)